MDFLDPKKMRRHAILLYTGYIFIGIAILISATVLVYQANGFGVNSKGQVVQSGLVFVSTQPNPATIYLNGKQNDVQTNNRLSLAAGVYSLKLTRSGYRDWSRTIAVQGGDVQNYDYPFLFPTNLKTTSEASYGSIPGVATQSRDRRWLLVQQNATSLTFDVYDLKQEKLVSAPFTLPTNIVTVATGTQSWETIQWANDAKHVLLKHTFTGGSEYIMLDREDPAQSVNLNKILNAKPIDLTLIDNKYDQYYLLDANNDLLRASRSDPVPASVVKGVISYKSYGTDKVLYASSQNAPTGKVNVMILDGDTTYTIRQVTAGATYLLDVADYRGSEYVVLAASTESVAYIYRDPIGQLNKPAITAPVALRAIKVPNTAFVSFSPSTRYIMSQSGSEFGIYDIYLQRSYTYNTKKPLDTPQVHAEWMDGDHLTYISDGNQQVFDFDGHNPQTLESAAVAQGAFFSQDYRYAFAFAPNASGVVQLNRIGLWTATDL